MKKNNNLITRILMSALGVTLTAVSVAILKLAAFGVDPFQSFMFGIVHISGVSFGTMYVIVNAALLIFSLLFDRHYIGIATFINLFLLGYITNFTLTFLTSCFPSPTLSLRVFSLIIGIVILCFGSSLYITADLGVSTYDAIALILSKKWKIASFKAIRVTTDFVCVVSGIILFLLGGGKTGDIPTFVGIGTIITAFFMGPLIEAFNKVSKKLLNSNAN